MGIPAWDSVQYVITMTGRCHMIMAFAGFHAWIWRKMSSTACENHWRASYAGQCLVEVPKLQGLDDGLEEATPCFPACWVCDRIHGVPPAKCVYPCRCFLKKGYLLIIHVKGILHCKPSISWVPCVTQIHVRKRFFRHKSTTGRKAKIKEAETEKNQKKARDIAEQRPGAGSPVLRSSTDELGGATKNRCVLGFFGNGMSTSTWGVP